MSDMSVLHIILCTSQFADAPAQAARRAAALAGARLSTRSLALPVALPHHRVMGHTRDELGGQRGLPPMRVQQLCVLVMILSLVNLP